MWSPGAIQMHYFSNMLAADIFDAKNISSTWV